MFLYLKIAIAKDLTKSKIFSSKDKIVSNNTPITRRKSGKYHKSNTKI